MREARVQHLRVCAHTLVPAVVQTVSTMTVRFHFQLKIRQI